MIDSHIHFDKQPYSIDTINKMVEVAINNNITEINLLDHTHKFSEFAPLYLSLVNNSFAWDWYQRKKQISLTDYLDFIKLVKTYDFPIKINFGLEVCFFKEKVDWLKAELSKYDFDFLIGSVHFIDNIPFDLSLDNWKNQDKDMMYKRYYEIMEDLIKSQIFTSLAHPDSIKLFNIYPQYDLIPTYEKIAKLLYQYNVATENNTGLWRYNFSYPGINKQLYTILKDNNVRIYKASDAHTYDKIGYLFTDIKN